jgi:hypothetical protein
VVAAVVLFGGVLALGIFMFRFQQQRGEELLEAWAARQGYRLLSREPANPPGTGPMHRSASNKQVMYRVRVSDDAGQVREGTVRVGAPATGVLSDEVSVEWDRPPQAPASPAELETNGAHGLTAGDFGIPFYPGAQQDPGAAQRLLLGAYYQRQATFTSRDPIERILAFYRAEMKRLANDAGVLAETSSEGKVSLILKRGEREVLVVAIEPPEADGGVQIQLSATGLGEAEGP